MNGLVLDLYPEGRGRALNLLHLFFSLGALASPLAVGRLVEAGAGWQAIIIGTALVAIPLAILFAVVAMPSGRHARSAGTATVRVGLSLPIIALAVAIACYVASEIGVSNWLVRFLETASIGLATSALALFWGCLALGRHRDRVARRSLRPCAVRGHGGVRRGESRLSPPSSCHRCRRRVVLFGLVGFAFGPVYPLIMAVGGDLYPTRSAAVSGFLSGSAIFGAILYPPLMGFISVEAGLTVAMIGAAILSFACAAVLFALGRRESQALEGATEPA